MKNFNLTLIISISIICITVLILNGYSKIVKEFLIFSLPLIIGVVGGYYIAKATKSKKQSLNKIYKKSKL